LGFNDVHLHLLPQDVVEHF
jgi:hypothetical protein